MDLSGVRTLLWYFFSHRHRLHDICTEGYLLGRSGCLRLWPRRNCELPHTILMSSFWVSEGLLILREMPNDALQIYIFERAYHVISDALFTESFL